jgi:hypothetical protein
MERTPPPYCGLWSEKTGENAKKRKKTGAMEQFFSGFSCKEAGICDTIKRRRASAAHFAPMPPRWGYFQGSGGPWAPKEENLWNKRF